jgi:hypothetical protein
MGESVIMGNFFYFSLTQNLTYNLNWVVGFISGSTVITAS